MKPMTGKGQFQWNSGGWFGAQLGSTCWLLIFVVMLAVWGAVWQAAVMGVLFLAPNIAGLAMWLRRDRLQPYTAIQLLLASVTMAAFGAMAFMKVAVPAKMQQPGVSMNSSYLSLLIFPGLMLMFHFIEKGARKRNQDK